MPSSTRDITVQYVKTALRKKVESHGSGVAEPDQRGKHHNRPFKYPEVVRNLIRAHIQNFPIIDSHYVRATTSKQFLPEELNVSMMSRMLMTEVRRAGIENVEISRHLYDHIFNTEFNLSFFTLKKDGYVSLLLHYTKILCSLQYKLSDWKI
ncbi:unnamed protein product [Trichogramma brassicae]|uniref:Uncharacterized protein n=1 Tax=Trichogramma brassicae TaxID=86971 RepID=A0A6H5IXI5_9HYME|nr:unnamed protein product [Trichogramma brassicae]